MQIASGQHERRVLLEPRPRGADQGPDEIHRKKQHLIHKLKLHDKKCHKNQMSRSLLHLTDFKKLFGLVLLEIKGLKMKCFFLLSDQHDECTLSW